MLKDRTHWFPPLFLLIVAALFLLPALFPPEGHALGSLDMRSQFYLWVEQIRASLYAGQIPWWDGTLFAGYPFLANPQIAIFYPPMWLPILLTPRFGFTLYVLLHLWLAGMGMYYFMKELGLGGTHQGRDKPSAAPFIVHLAPALLFMFSGFFAARIYAGHIGLLATHAWVPWLLWGTSWSLRRGGWHTAVIAGLPWGLTILAGNSTSLIYVSLVWGAWILFLFGQGPTPAGGTRWQMLRQVSLTAVVGFLIAAVQLVPLAQLVQVADRTNTADFTFATAFSFPPAHLITLLLPHFFGEPTRVGYWSVPNFEELAWYAGLLPLLALPWALRRPRPLTWFWLILALVGLLLALGHYGFLYGLVYDLLPLFRLARAPARALFLFSLATAVLLGLALSPQEKLPPHWQAWWGSYVAIWLVGGLTALAATGAVFASVHPTETSGRLWQQIGGWGVFTAVVLAGGLLLAQHHRPALRPRAQTAVAAALALLIISDLWLFGAKLVVTENMTPDAFWFGARDLIGETDQRVLPWGVSIFAQNGAAQVGLNSVFGYNALELGANTALASSVPDPRSTAYDILGAGYVVAQSPLDQFTEGAGGLQLIGEQGGGWVYARPRPFALARLVYQTEIMPDQATAVSRVHQPDFDPATTAILDSDPACPLPASGTGTGTAVVISQASGAWRIQTSSDEAALLLLSETAYPGWEVRVNGERAEWQTAYTAVRAVCVPAGEALVEWQFRPWIFLWGGLLSLLGLALVGVAVAFPNRRGTPL